MRTVRAHGGFAGIAGSAGLLGLLVVGAGLVACGGSDEPAAGRDVVGALDAPAGSDARPGRDVARVDTPEPPPSVGCGPSLRAPDTAWYRTAVVYEVFVRSFRDSDGDGVGDLRGLIQKLDYLQDGDPATDRDLGVTALWLMPITAAASYHGYDTTDYEQIDPDYGDLRDFEDLVRLLRQRDMKLVLDLVLNHTSLQHPWFVDAASGPQAERRGWYVWSAEDLGWTQPTGGGQRAWNRGGDSFYYAAFWSGMPDLNYQNPFVTDEALRISRLWLDRGVDGFRLDAVRFLIETGPGQGLADTAETIAWWRHFRQTLEQEYPNAAHVAEAWTSRAKALPYLGPAEDPGLQMAFDFDLQLAIDEDLPGSGAPDDLWDALCAAIEDTPNHAQNAPFLSNHDMTRFATRVRGDVPSMKLGAALLLTLPGTPFLYYGEEIGLPNGPTPADENKRLPMRWEDGAGYGFTSGTPWYDARYDAAAPTVAAQTDDPDSLLSHYRQLIRLRRGHPALFSGRTELLPPESLSDPALLAYVRKEAEETLLVVHNTGAADLAAVTIDLTGIVLAPAAPRPGAVLWGGAAATADGQTLTLTALPARGSAVLAL
jgi:glycosidase